MRRVLYTTKQTKASEGHEAVNGVNEPHDKQKQVE